MSPLAGAAGLSERVCGYTFRATGITASLEYGGTLENAEAIAAHESPRTTKLYNWTADAMTRDGPVRTKLCDTRSL
jgi:integrase/recombinase XerD